MDDPQIPFHKMREEVSIHCSDWNLWVISSRSPPCCLPKPFKKGHGNLPRAPRIINHHKPTITIMNRKGSHIEILCQQDLGAICFECEKLNKETTNVRPYEQLTIFPTINRHCSLLISLNG